MTTTKPGETDPSADLSRSEAGVRLLVLLKGHGYRFITSTPATHRRVVRQRTATEARNLRDVFGWSLPFSADLLSPEIFGALRAMGGLRREGEAWRSAYRVSSLAEDLFLHAAYPPAADDAVFFGPDTYRFARLIRQVIAGDQVDRVIDIGAGSGAGAVVAQRAGGARTLILTDINPAALATAQMNLQAGGLRAELRHGSGLDAVPETADLIVANPPFILGPGGRTYRDGGDMKGARLSLEWALSGAEHLTSGGRLVLYTGSAIVEGEDDLLRALHQQLDPSRFDLAYEELDPDIFSGQLSAPGYEDVERIAAIGAVISRRAP